MLCFDNKYTDIYFNLAAEEYLLKHSEENYCIIWQSHPSVVLGKHQNVYAEVDIDFVQANDIHIARRYSGGGTVYHDLGNINITFIETTSKINFDKYIQLVSNVLSDLKIDTEINERRALFTKGHKISGSAQCIFKNRVLFHCTLLFNSDLYRLNKALESKDENSIYKGPKIFVKSVKSPTANISTYLGKDVTIEKFKDFLLTSFAKKLSVSSSFQLNNELTNEINMLRNSKYATTDWNINSI